MLPRSAPPGALGGHRFAWGFLCSELCLGCRSCLGLAVDELSGIPGGSFGCSAFWAAEGARGDLSRQHQALVRGVHGRGGDRGVLLDSTGELVARRISTRS